MSIVKYILINRKNVYSIASLHGDPSLENHLNEWKRVANSQFIHIVPMTFRNRNIKLFANIHLIHVAYSVDGITLLEIIASQQWSHPGSIFGR